MKLFSLLKLAILLFACLPFTNFSQISVTPGLTAQELAEIFAGSNLTVSNATLTGSPNAVGSFTSSGFIYSSGILLCTGLAANAAGPNDDPNTGDNLSQPGDPALAALGGAASRDAAILEFDFVVQSASVQFNYVFASEEYPEFAPPNQPDFTDVFAFFISGPGIVGEENIALIPGTAQAINIQNVNAVTNQQYYLDNTGGQEIQFDGYTTNLSATKSGLTPCQTYHLKLMISDIRTSVRNSAVFFEENSFVQDAGNLIVSSQTIQADNVAREGCTKGSFTFRIPAPEATDRLITFSIGGTAVNGVDYQYIDNSLLIPAGDTSATLYINAFSDGIPEGQETIVLDFDSGGCAGAGTSMMNIDDAEPIQFTLDKNNLTCFENNTGEISVDASGGFPPYNFTYINSEGAENVVNSSPITGLAADQYTVRVTDAYGCKAEALVIGGLFNAGTTFLPDGTGVTYEAPLTISGFGVSEVITNVNQIQQVCVTLEHSYMGDLDIELVSPNNQVIMLKSNGFGSADLGEPVATGPFDNGLSNDPTPGIGYEYCFNANPTFGTMNSLANAFFRDNYTDVVGNVYSDNYMPAGSYTPEGNFNALVGSTMNGDWKIRVTDNAALDNGYIFNWYISLIGDLPDSTITISEPSEILINGISQDATCGIANGLINVTTANALQPYTVLWSNGMVTEDISNINAGSYTITVTDNNSCSSGQTFIVNNSSSLDLTAVVSAVSCFNGNNGAINLSVTGGQAPYNFLWSNGSILEDLANLTPGTYMVTVTDQQGCSKLLQVDVPNATPITITSVALQNEQCNTDNGAVSVLASGGSGSYAYAWSNGANSPDLSGLSAGSYTVTASDNLGCSSLQTFTIINDISNCSSFCFLDVDLNSSTDELCGQGNGSLDATILNAVQPINISWSNGLNTEDLSALSAGEYTITVIDANACSVSKTFTVLNNSGTLAISQSTINDELCSNNQGSIDITVSGGVLPYSYTWSNGANAEDLTNLNAGTYSLTIRDGNNCEINQTFTVNSTAGNLVVIGTTSQSFCGTNNGTITQTVSGENGTLSYLWESGATTQNRMNLAPGNYSCLISDQLGCMVQNDYTIVESSGDIQVLGINVLSEVCGNSQGSINMTTSGTGLSYIWSNGLSTQDITGLSAGNYSCMILNDQGCSLSTGNIYVGNSNGGILLSTVSNLPEVCNQNNGSLDISVIGGTSPYTFSWSNASINEDLTNLSAGVYTVNVTDAAGCIKSQSFTINDNPGTLSIDNAANTNNFCGTTIAAIDLTIGGGTSPYTINWNTGDVVEDLANLSAGIYTVTITDASACVVNQSYEILGAFQVNAAITDETCGQNNGALNVSIAGGQAPYTFLWSNGENTEDIGGLSAGTFSLSVTDNTACVVNRTFSIVNQVGTLAVSGNIIDETCGQGNGLADITVSGGFAPISYVWNTGVIVEDLNSLSAGSYFLTVTDALGCSVDYNAIIANITNGLSLSLNAKTDENCGLADGSIDITTSGSGTITYLWSNGNLTEDISGISSGSYTLTATDDLGCSTSITEAIGNQTGSLAITFSNTVSPLCGISNGFIDIEVAGVGPFSYAWSNGAITQDIVALVPNTYSVQITDANGCTLNQSFDLNSASTPISFTAIVTNADCGQSNGQINLTVTGGTAPYTFAWSNGAFSEDISGLSAGTYQVLITDFYGCSSSSSYSVTTLGNSLITVNNVFINPDFCTQGFGSIQIFATGVQNWYINGVQDFNFGNFFNLMAGDYTITMEDFNGCSLDELVTVQNQANFTITQVVTDETCGGNNGAIDITPNDIFGQGLFFTYSWNTGAVSQDLTNLSEGTYTVTVTDNFGCSLPSTAIVSNQTGTFAITNAVVTPSNCGTASGAIDITIAGGTAPYSISWSNGAGTEDISNLLAGMYVVTVTDASNCSLTESYTINNNFQLTGVVTDASCSLSNGAINISMIGGVGPFTFAWSNGAVSEDLSNLTAGIYDVTVTDNNGCQTSGSFTVDELVGIQVFNIFAQADFCTQGFGSIQVNANGVNNFYIDGVLDFSGGFFFNLTAGTYVITMEDFNGCTIDTSIVVGNQANFTITQVVTDETCGGNNGAIDITPNDIFGQGLFFTYSWNTGAVSQDLTNLSEGTYTVTVTDNFGCSLPSTAIVSNQTGTFAITNAVVTPSNCGTASGAIDITIAGGTAPYSIFWSNGAGTEDISNLLAGMYVVTITDASNCSLTESYTINNNFQLTGVVTDASCSLSNGAINISMIGGVGPFTFAWSNGAVSEDLSNLTAGIYNVTVTDNNGCQTSGSFTVDELLSFSISSIVTQPNFCSQNFGSIDIFTNGAVSEFYIDGVPNFGSGSFFNLSEGSYTITIEDFTGCSIDTVVTIINQMTFTPSFVVTDETCGATNGAINMSVSDDFGLGEPFSYQWSTGSTNEDLNTLVAGTYSVQITHELMANFGFDCVNSYDVVVNNQTGTFAITNAVVTPSNCGTASGAIDITIAGGTAPYSISWSNGAGTEDISNLLAGMYVVTITDASNCSLTESYTINNNFQLTGVVTDASCSLSNGAINISMIGGVGPFTFAWSNGAVSEDLSNLTAGIYDVTVTDNNGCQTSGSFTVNELLSFSISSIVTQPNFCSQNFGSIDIFTNGAVSEFYIDGVPNFGSGSFFNLSEGSYTITIEDFTGCSIDTVVTIINQMTFTPSFVVTDETCGATNGAINMSVSDDFGLGEPFIYQWSTGSTNEDLNTLVAGTYSVQITHELMANFGFDCVNSYDVVVNSGTGFTAMASVTSANCTNNNGGIDITLDDGGTGMTFTYIWSNGSANQDLTNVTSGNYSLIITNQDGCNLVEIYTVPNVNSLTLNNSVTVDEGCAQSNGSIDLTVVGSNPVSFAWSNGANMEDLSNLDGGTYSCFISDANGCTMNLAFIIDEISDLTLNSLDIISDTCLQAKGQILIDAAGSITNYLIDGVINPGSTFQNLGAGSHLISIQSASGCDLDTLVTVPDTGTMTLSASIQDEFCNNSNGSIDLTISGGFTPLDFSWSNGSNQEDLTNVSAGNYTVIVTDNSGCQETINASVVNNTGTLAISDANISDATCSGSDGSINLTVSGGSSPLSYSWSNGAVSEDLANISSGVYTVVVMDANFCQLTNTFVVNPVNPLGFTTLTLEDDNCDLGVGQIEVSTFGGVTDIYVNSVLQTGTTFANLSSGTYTITIANNQGCSIDSSVIITSTPMFTVQSNIVDENCGQANGLIDLTVNGGAVPIISSWDNGANTVDLANLAAGTYTVTLTDQNNCSFTDTYTVANQTSNLAISTAVLTDEQCDAVNGAIDITISGGVLPYVIEWDNGAATEDLSGLDAGTYSVVVTDNNNCSVNAQYDIVSVTAIAFTSVSVQQDQCNQGTGLIQIQTSGNVNEIRLDGILQSSNMMPNLSSGTYVITIGNGLGCTFDTTVVISSLISFDLSASMLHETCGQNNGSINLVIDSLNQSNLDLTYNWSNGSMTQDIFNLTAGSYSVTVTNTDGCTQTGIYTIDSLYSAFVPVTADITNASCFNCSDGSIDMSPDTFEGQSYLWSNGVATEDISGLSAGTYELMITNELGCDTSMSVTVSYEPNAEIIFSLSPNPAIDDFKVIVSFPDGELGTVTMYDYLGQIVYQSPEMNAGVLNFNTSEYSAATYFFAAKSTSVFEQLKFQILK